MGRKEFPDMRVDVLDEIKDLKSDALKKRWREFCEAHKDVEDYSFATLLRLDSSGEYEEQNSVIVTKIQFYAIELARNREGHNSSIRHNSKPKRREPKKIEATNEATNQLSKEVECELQKILTGKHELMK